MIEAVVILMVFGLGYAIGRRVGIKHGQQLGFVQAAIDLRIHALEQGVCPICRFGYDAVKNDTDMV